MSEPRSFQSADRVTVKGVGLVFTFHGIEGFNPRTLKAGERVDIDGQPYIVRGVETFAIMDPTGFNFGICVESDSLDTLRATHG